MAAGSGGGDGYKTRKQHTQGIKSHPHCPIAGILENLDLTALRGTVGNLDRRGHHLIFPKP